MGKRNGGKSGFIAKQATLFVALVLIAGPMVGSFLIDMFRSNVVGFAAWAAISGYWLHSCLKSARDVYWIGAGAAWETGPDGSPKAWSFSHPRLNILADFEVKTIYIQTRDATWKDCRSDPQAKEGKGSMEATVPMLDFAYSNDLAVRHSSHANIAPGTVYVSDPSGRSMPHLAPGMVPDGTFTVGSAPIGRRLVFEWAPRTKTARRRLYAHGPDRFEIARGSRVEYLRIETVVDDDFSERFEAEWSQALLKIIEINTAADAEVIARALANEA